MATTPFPLLTEHAYLQLERAAEYKSEFIDGEMFAMAGGSPRHSMLGGNAYAELRAQLKGKRCRALTSEMRIRTPETGSQLYPDVSVACGPIQMHPGSNDMMVNPAVINRGACTFHCPLRLAPEV